MTNVRCVLVGYTIKNVRVHSYTVLSSVNDMCRKRARHDVAIRLYRCLRTVRYILYGTSMPAGETLRARGSAWLIPRPADAEYMTRKDVRARHRPAGGQFVGTGTVTKTAYTRGGTRSHTVACAYSTVLTAKKMYKK